MATNGPEIPRKRQNGPEIRRRRQALGVKIGPFADRVDCSFKHLNNIENGHKQASPELLNRIARELSCDVEELTADTGTGEQVPA